MGAARDSERHRLKEAVEKTVEELRPVIATSQHIDLVKFPNLAESVVMGLTMQAVLEVLQGLRDQLPADIDFDRTAAAVVANRIHESVPAWEIRAEAYNFLANLADQHQSYIATVGEGKADVEPLR